MSHLIIKTVKLTIWGLLPMLFGMPGEDGHLYTTLSQNPGTYHLTAAGEKDILLEGDIFYETVQDFQEDGRTYSILKFQLAPVGNNATHTLGFYIAREKGAMPLGTYRMAEDIDGFLHRFDGVFAFADINVLGEQPFFAKTGKLTIDYSVPKALGGSLAVTMRNASGQTVAIRGDFMAVQKE
jgi:hypothetical protein